MASDVVIVDLPDMFRAFSSLGLPEPQIFQPILGSASERRYFRVECANRNFVLCVLAMSALDPTLLRRHEVATHVYRSAGIPVPLIVASGVNFLVFEDGGHSVYPRNGQKQMPIPAMEFAITIASDLIQKLDSWPVTSIGHATEASDSLDLSLLPPRLAQVVESVFQELQTFPFAFQHGDLHARNLLIDMQGRYSVVDIQDTAPAPYITDLSLVAVDPNYDVDVSSTDYLVAAFQFRALSRPKLASIIAGRSLSSDLELGMIWQSIRLVAVCRSLFLRGKGEVFEREALRSERRALKLLGESTNWA